jgi:hypothetical protein
VAAFAVLIPRYSGVSASNRVQLSWPRLKVPRAAYRWAAAVNKSVPPGSHVAVPSGIDQWVVTFRHHSCPLAVGHYLRIWPGKFEWEELRDRNAMRSFLDTPELVEANPQQFRDGLDRFEVRAVCLVNSPRAGAARAILQQAGFRQVIFRDDYTLWVRTASQPYLLRAGRIR